MNTGKETWKWALVVLLLAVFLITANQAYQNLANQEDYDAPDDYLKGDSWDLEHQTGPGAGQPVSINKDNMNNATSDKNKPIKINERLSAPKPIVFDDESNWSQSQNKSDQPVTEPVKETVKEEKESLPNKTTEQTTDNSNLSEKSSEQLKQAVENNATDIAPKQEEKTSENNLPENEIKQPEQASENKTIDNTPKQEEKTSDNGSTDTASKPVEQAAETVSSEETTTPQPEVTSSPAQ